MVWQMLRTPKLPNILVFKEGILSFSSIILSCGCVTELLSFWSNSQKQFYSPRVLAGVGWGEVGSRDTPKASRRSDSKEAPQAVSRAEGRRRGCYPWAPNSKLVLPGTMRC